MARARSFLGILLVCAFGSTVAVVAADYGWRADFTDGSDPGLAALHGDLVSENRIDPGAGLVVRDVHVSLQDFDLHLVEGTLWLEASIDGARVGAWFEGTATATFVPREESARASMNVSFGSPRLAAETLSRAYLFVLGESDLAAALGASGPSPARPDVEEYARTKRALSRLGTEPLDLFLNREGRARGATLAFLALDSIRGGRSDNALALYTWDPSSDPEVSLRVAGHKELTRHTDARFLFFPVTKERAEPARFLPAGRVDLYRTELSVGNRAESAEQRATIEFVPNAGVSSVRLGFTPRMEVSAVLAKDGTALPFVQWEWSEAWPDYDRNLTVAFPAPLPPGEPTSITVVSAGRLFEPIWTMHRLADEDTWHPRMDDPGSSRYETILRVPKNKVGVAAGTLIEESVDGDRRVFHYRTKRPHPGSTVYFGEFASETAEADDTVVEVFVDAFDQQAGGNLKFAAVEVANAIKVFNRLFRPLELDHVRVTATPTSHGRGFEGIILLSLFGFQDNSVADLFRAHEVAHQWWGNVIQPRNWPEDRWLSEAFAEYAAFEYYQIRYGDDSQTRRHKNAQWIEPTFSERGTKHRTLTGEKSKENLSEISPIIRGGSNVYSKGPLVLHGIRYLFEAKYGDDAKFWEMLRDFLETHAYDPVTTAEFRAVAEKHLGQPLDWYFRQWVYRAEIPEFEWSWKLVNIPNGVGLEVTATETTDTGFIVVVPVTARFRGGETVTRSMLIQDGAGLFRVALPARPREVTVNDDHQALARFDKK